MHLLAPKEYIILAAVCNSGCVGHEGPPLQELVEADFEDEDWR